MDDKSPKKTRLQRIFGTYEFPEWVKNNCNKLKRFFIGIGRLFILRKIVFLCIGIVLILGCIGFGVFRFFQAKNESFVERNTSSNNIEKVKTLKVKSYCNRVDSTIGSEGEINELLIYFTGSVCPLESLDSDVTNLISISPSINGSAIWVQQDCIKFQPTEPWKINQKYTVKFEKTGLFPDYIQAPSSTEFVTSEFIASFNNGEFVIDPINPERKQALYTITTSHLVDIEQMKSLIKISPPEKTKAGMLPIKKYDFEVSYSKDDDVYYILSEPIPIPTIKTELICSIKEGLKAQVGSNGASKLQKSIFIPGSEDYIQINSVNINMVKDETQNYQRILVVSSEGQSRIQDVNQYIEAYLLPINKPKEAGIKEVKNFSWDYFQANEMTDTILSQSERIELTPIESQEEYSSDNSFTFYAPESRSIYVHIKSGIPFLGGYTLNKEFHSIQHMELFPRQLSIMSEGSVLSLSGSKKLPIYSRGIYKVLYKIARIKPDQINHLITMSNGNMSDFNFTSYNFNENNIADVNYAEFDVPNPSSDKVSFFSFDFANNLGVYEKKNLKSGLFLFTAEDEEDLSLSDRRLILITDLALIVKSGLDNSKDVFIQSVATGKPLANVEVQLIALNGDILLNSYTRNDGHVHFDGAQIEEFLEKRSYNRPVAYVAKLDNDTAFIPFNQYDRLLDYSDFDTGGTYGSTKENRLFAYLFSDRGLYRPGDTINIGLVTKAGDWSYDISSTPIEIAVVDPNNSEIFSQQLLLSNDGIDEISFNTEEYSPTGSYTVYCYLLKKDKRGVQYREYLNSEMINVEEFLPDTLALSAVFDPLPAVGWVNPENISGKITLRNLFGTPAVGNDVKATINLLPGLPRFSKYSDYYFFDPLLKTNQFSEDLGTKVTSDDGTVSFSFDLEKFEKATYRLEFFTEAFEKGSGRSVSNQSAMYVSPLKYLIGYKSDANLSYINKQDKCKLDFIAINSNLDQIDLSDISLVIEEKRYVSVLVREPSGVYKYRSVQKNYPVSTENFSISKEGTSFYLPCSVEGEYVLSLKDKDGLVFNTVNFSVIGEKNISRSLTRTAQLDIKLESNKLNNGDTAKLFIKAPYEGSGLITIERDKVYTWKWFSTTELSSTQTIDIPMNQLEGNGYINVMFSRSASSKEVYMSPFCYGSVPFSINKEKRTNTITLDIPNEAKSGTEFPITYSSDKKGKAIIYAVDDGILQVGNYSAPNPLGYFFKKRALEVYTSQFLDLVLPEYKVVQAIQATGGGIEMELLAKNLNPFKRKQNKPVVYWSGIVDISNEKRTLTYKVPEYFNGNLRIMAVSVSPDTLGTTQKTAIVKNPLVIIPNSPSVSAPGDEFEVSVTVTNTIKGSGKNASVVLTAEPSEHLSIISSKQIPLSIDEGKDAVVTFNVKTENKLGAGEIKFTAKCGDEVANNSTYLSIRPLMPYQVWISSGYLNNSESVKLDVSHKLYDEFSTRNVSMAYMPLSLANGLCFYLEKYPYGCTEQIVSATFPFLFPELINEFKYSPQQIKQNVARTISVLQARLKENGNIGLWTYASNDNNNLTTYCAYFLTMAQNVGHYVPASLMNSVLNRLKEIAVLESESFYCRAFAIYVLTMNDIVTTSELTKLKAALKTTSYDSDYAQLYMAASYKMLQQKKQANELIKVIGKKFTKSTQWIYVDSLDFASRYVEIISKYFPEYADTINEQLIYMSNELKGCNYTTYSAASALSALSSCVNLMPKAETGNYSIEQITGKDVTPLTATGNVIFSTAFSDNAEQIQLKNNQDYQLYYQTTQAGYETTSPTKEVRNNLEINREFLTVEGDKISSIKVGDIINVKISFKTLNNKDTVNNLAIVDMLPSGFEAEVESIRSNNGGWKPDYVDVREDRVVLFGTAFSDISTYTYRVRATSIGKFTVPVLYAEAMYDKMVKAIKPHNPINITAR